MVTEIQTQSPQIPEQRENPWREVPPSEEVRTYEEQVGSAEMPPELEVGEQDLVTKALVDRLQQKLTAQAEEKRLRAQVPASRPSQDLRALNQK